MSHWLNDFCVSCKTKCSGKEYLSKQLAHSFQLTDLSFSLENHIELFKFILLIHLLLKCDDLGDKVRKLPVGLRILLLITHCKCFIQDKPHTAFSVQVKKFYQLLNSWGLYENCTCKTSCTLMRGFMSLCDFLGSSGSKAGRQCLADLAASLMYRNGKISLTTEILSLNNMV